MIIYRHIQLKNKALRYMVLLLFIAFNAIWFAQGEEQFIQANKAYNQEAYEKAITSYTEILNSGQESVSVYYNLANAYYKTNAIASSIYYYEKALQLSPNDEDVQNNLAYVNKATIDKIDTIPEGFITIGLQNVVRLLSLDGWAWCSVLTMICFVLSCIAYYTYQDVTRKRLFFITSIVILGMSIISVCFSFTKQNIKAIHYAIIFTQETTVKSEPNLRSEAVFVLHEGTKVQVLEDVNNWKKIKIADGQIGWIATDDLKLL